MRVQSEEDNLTKVGRIQMGNHMIEQSQDLPGDALERAGKFVCVLCRENRLVRHRLLRESHHVVDVLRCGHARLLALLVEPQVHPAKGIKERSVVVAARG